MDKASEALFALKPVMFRYKKQVDPDQGLDYGLIAEDVAKVAPELAVRDGEGNMSNYRRDAINAMRQLRADATLTEEQRRHQLEELHSATEGKLVQVLGVKGTAMASRGDWWLQDPTTSYGP